MGELTMSGELVDWVVAAGGGGGGHQIARVMDVSSTKSTSSQSWVDVDGTHLSIALTTDASWVLLGLIGTMQSQASPMHTFLDFTVDGVRVGQGWGLTERYWPATGSRESVSLLCPVQVAAGSHTFRPQWKVSAGGVYLYAETSYCAATFFAIEMK